MSFQCISEYVLNIHKIETTVKTSKKPVWSVWPWRCTRPYWVRGWQYLRQMNSKVKRWRVSSNLLQHSFRDLQKILFWLSQGLVMAFWFLWKNVLKMICGLFSNGFNCLGRLLGIFYNLFLWPHKSKVRSLQIQAADLLGRWLRRDPGWWYLFPGAC